MKKSAKLAIFLCFMLTTASFADNNTENWCGTYFEDNGQAYLRLAKTDFGSGSAECTIDTYNAKIETSGTANIMLDFTHSRSSLNNWRKFTNHLIEVRGKYSNGSIKSARLIRDMGV